MSRYPVEDEYKRTSSIVNVEQKKLFDPVEGQLRPLSELRSRGFKARSSKPTKNEKNGKVDRSGGTQTNKKSNNPNQLEFPKSPAKKVGKDAGYEGINHITPRSSRYQPPDLEQLGLTDKSLISKSIDQLSISDPRNAARYGGTSRVSELRFGNLGSVQNVKLLESSYNLNMMSRCFSLLKPESSLRTDKIVPFASENISSNLVISNFGRSSVGKSTLMSLIIDPDCTSHSNPSKNVPTDPISASFAKNNTNPKTNSQKIRKDKSGVTSRESSGNQIFKINDSGSSSNDVGCFINPLTGMTYLDFPPIFSDINTKKSSNNSSRSSNNNRRTQSTYSKYDLLTTISNIIWSDLILVVIEYNPSTGSDDELVGLLIEAKNAVFEIQKTSRFHQTFTLPKLILIYQTFQSCALENHKALCRRIVEDFCIDSKNSPIEEVLTKSGFVVENVFVLPKLFSNNLSNPTALKNFTISPLETILDEVDIKNEFMNSPGQGNINYYSNLSQFWFNLAANNNIDPFTKKNSTNSSSLMPTFTTRKRAQLNASSKANSMDSLDKVLALINSVKKPVQSSSEFADSETNLEGYYASESENKGQEISLSGWLDFVTITFESIKSFVDSKY
ncbi:hypothetical protein AYI68_g6966 [Smittium mucronatum]|uniref:Uncharacterized protein n=1 Tax=Smittium mucronatum TaxID=133383 RepID=A0A1R0GQ26_9FUNG|nr:hypothetical protein AYI68_g6966 [Smittium mucronatum]